MLVPENRIGTFKNLALSLYGDTVELIPIDCSKIRDTVLNLLKDLPDLAQCVRD